MRHARDVAIGGRPRRARGTRVAPTLLAWAWSALAMAMAVNGQNGTYVDVTPTVTEQVADRFGTQPSHRSGHTMVRAPPRDPERPQPPRPSAPTPPRRPPQRIFFWRVGVNHHDALSSGVSSPPQPHHLPIPPPHPQTRVDATTAVVFGGLTPHGAANDVWEWKVSTGNWTRLHPGGDPPADGSEPIPPRRVGHSAVILRGDLWIFGGYDVTGGDMNDLWRFSRAEGRWYAVELPEGATAPASRSGHAAFAPTDDGDAFFVFGGNMRNDVWEFDVGGTAWRVVMGESAATSGGGRRRGGGVFLALGMATLLAAMM